MEDLIKQLHSLVSEYCTSDQAYEDASLSKFLRARFIGRDDVCLAINRLLARYESCHPGVSSDQLHQLNSLVITARDYFELLFKDNSLENDMYRCGYINAIESVMRIFGIDLKFDR